MTFNLRKLVSIYFVETAYDGDYLCAGAKQNLNSLLFGSSYTDLFKAGYS